jgi:hypothetical protein
VTPAISNSKDDSNSTTTHNDRNASNSKKESNNSTANTVGTPAKAGTLAKAVMLAKVVKSATACWEANKYIAGTPLSLGIQKVNRHKCRKQLRKSWDLNQAHNCRKFLGMDILTHIFLDCFL